MEFYFATELEGYKPKAPSDEAEELDRDICQFAHCEKCGHLGLEYRPFSKPGSFRTFVVCPACGHISEF